MRLSHALPVSISLLAVVFLSPNSWTSNIELLQLKTVGVAYASQGGYHEEEARSVTGTPPALPQKQKSRRLPRSDSPFRKGITKSATSTRVRFREPVKDGDSDTEGSGNASAGTAGSGRLGRGRQPGGGYVPAPGSGPPPDLPVKTRLYVRSGSDSSPIAGAERAGSGGPGAEGGGRTTGSFQQSKGSSAGGSGPGASSSGWQFGGMTPSERGSRAMARDGPVLPEKKVLYTRLVPASAFSSVLPSSASNERRRGLSPVREGAESGEGGFTNSGSILAVGGSSEVHSGGPQSGGTITQEQGFTGSPGAKPKLPKKQKKYKLSGVRSSRGRASFVVTGQGSVHSPCREGGGRGDVYPQQRSVREPSSSSSSRQFTVVQQSGERWPLPPSTDETVYEAMRRIGDDIAASMTRNQSTPSAAHQEYEVMARFPGRGPARGAPYQGLVESTRNLDLGSSSSGRSTVASPVPQAGGSLAGPSPEFPHYAVPRGRGASASRPPLGNFPHYMVSRGSGPLASRPLPMPPGRQTRAPSPSRPSVPASLGPRIRTVSFPGAPPFSSVPGPAQPFSPRQGPPVARRSVVRELARQNISFSR